jgi:hypothetical protein
MQLMVGDGHCFPQHLAPRLAIHPDSSSGSMIREHQEIRERAREVYLNAPWRGTWRGIVKGEMTILRPYWNRRTKLKKDKILRMIEILPAFPETEDGVTSPSSAQLRPKVTNR